MKTKETDNLWLLQYENYVPEEEGLREALCTLGNGYMGTRGANPETVASHIHYPGTYIAGVYNTLLTTVAGRKIANEDLVNCPNWTFMTFKIGDGEWFRPAVEKVTDYSQTLDMKRGLLIRTVRVQNRKGQITRVEMQRMVSMADPHVVAEQYIITPENYSEWITVKSNIDGCVINTGVDRYKQLNSKELKPVKLGGFAKNGIFLCSKTVQSKIEICVAEKLHVYENARELKPKMVVWSRGKERINHEFRVFAKRKQSYTIEKLASIYTSQDDGVRNSRTAALATTKKLRRFSTLLKTHVAAWDKLWKMFDVEIEGDEFSQRVVRLHLFHLMQTASPHNVHIDAGLPARGLTGEAYRGHIFWDELFAMPVYDLHDPNISKALLMYRYRRLGAARTYAKKNGYAGSMFPWQSGSKGVEETQVMHLNPMSGEWGADHSCRQRHVSFAIAYNTWEYFKRSDDRKFIMHEGGEMLLSIALFCASLAKHDVKTGRYHTTGIMGPDEFHEMLPGAKEAGLKDNAYSNIMIVWVLKRAQELLQMMDNRQRRAIMKKLKISDKELDRWCDITEKMNIIINDQGIISQFEGYFGLEDLDWDGYRKQYNNIQRLDRILKSEGKSPDKYKLAKQADTVMLFYVLDIDELKDIFGWLGYVVEKKMLEKNYRYYEARTSHGSTLSKVVHGHVALKLGMIKEAQRWFHDILESDIYDTQGGTTKEGIHAGVMGGSLNFIYRGFAGMTLTDDAITFKPILPDAWKRLRFSVRYRNVVYRIDIDRKSIRITARRLTRTAEIMPLEVNGKTMPLSAGRAKTVNYR